MVEVRINAKELEDLGNEVLRGQRVLNALTKAGVPALGILWPYGVSRGTLTLSTDELFDELVFAWSE